MWLLLRLLLLHHQPKPTITSTGAKFTFLNKGDVAPFAGTLFSVEATAKLLAEKERLEQECKLKLKYETDKLKAKCIRDTDLLSSELKIEKKKYNYHRRRPKTKK